MKINRFPIIFYILDPWRSETVVCSYCLLPASGLLSGILVVFNCELMLR